MYLWRGRAGLYKSELLLEVLQNCGRFAFWLQLHFFFISFLFFLTFQKFSQLNSRLDGKQAQSVSSPS